MFLIFNIDVALKKRIDVVYRIHLNKIPVKSIYRCQYEINLRTEAKLCHNQQVGLKYYNEVMEIEVVVGLLNGRRFLL